MLKNGFKELNRLKVLPEWIDYNGHMNVAFYVMAFDQSLDELLDEIELTRAYRDASNCTVYVLETHVSYLQEVKEGDPLLITQRVIDVDEKRIHLFLEMYHETEGFLAATSEQMILHIDASGPKAAPMPTHILDNLNQLQKEQNAYPMPERVAAQIGIRRKKSA
ncbi:MAG: thioesterase family protein [Sneathiellales bacterium]|nr:thioesterase family protein [Sneathiellales bacterium]